MIRKRVLLFIVLLLVIAGGAYYIKGQRWIGDGVLNLKWTISRKIGEKTQTAVGLIRTVDAFPRLQFSYPISIKFANDGSNTVYVAEMTGKIKRFDNDSIASRTTTVLDLTDRITPDLHMGLLDFALNPNSTTEESAYVLYNVQELGINYLILSNFRLDIVSGRHRAGKRERILLKMKNEEHQGGALVFGNDGFLYISIGDGQDTDPDNKAQNLGLLLGKVLRIDVDSDSERNYSIPQDNPFYKNKLGYREEIFAYGFRNPFRFSIDSLTNQFWLGDVGQGKFEEINLVDKGGNYGWKIKEAEDCYDPAQNCNQKGLIPPIFSYAHGIEGYSITGGLVYRGKVIPELYGKYIYGDYVRGAVWALSYGNDSVVKNELILNKAGNIVHFGEDLRHEIHYCDYVKGEVRKIVPAQNALLSSKVGYRN